MSTLVRKLSKTYKAAGSRDTMLRLTICLSVIAWLASVGATLSGLVSPLLGMTLFSMIATVLAAVVLLAPQINGAESQDEGRPPASASAFAPAPMAPAQSAEAPRQRLIAQSKAAAPARAPVAPAAPARAAAPSAVVPPIRRELMAQHKPAELMVLSRGTIEGREYAVFADGSIELETAFGPRWFASVELAHEFIGFRNGSLLRLAVSDLDIAQVA